MQKHIRGRLCYCTSPVSLGNQSANVIEKKKKVSSEAQGKGHFNTSFTLICYHLCFVITSVFALECWRSLGVMGHRHTVGHCVGYISGSVPRWMEKGKLLLAATRKGQREELSGCWRLHCPESMSQHFAGA